MTKRKNVYEQKLRDYITSQSESDDDDRAMDEWELAHMEYGFDRTCPCGKKHIVELWYIRNVFNNRLVFVGSKCIERFMGFHLPSGWNTLEKMFLGIPVIPKKEITAILPPHRLSEWERGFMDSMYNRYRGKIAKLTERQRNRLVFINDKIIFQITHWSLAFNQPGWEELTFDEANTRINQQIISTREKLARRRETRQRQLDTNRR